MAGSTANITWDGSSIGIGPVVMTGSKYSCNLLNLSGDVLGPIESTQSSSNINSVMFDLFSIPTFNEEKVFGEIIYYERMPCTEPISEYKIRIKIKHVEKPSPDPIELEGF